MESFNEVRKREERYRFLLEQKGQMIYEYNILTGEINWFGDTKGVMGFDIIELKEININEWENLIYPDDRERSLKYLDEAMEKRECYSVNYRLKSKNEGYKFIEDNGYFELDENGTPSNMIGLMRDISEQKLLEKKKEESDKHFRNLVEQSPFPIHIYNMDGFLINANKAWGDLWGIEDIDFILGKYNVLTDSQLEKMGYTKYLKRLFAGENIMIPEIEYNPDTTDVEGIKGRKRIIRVDAYPLKKPDGSFENIVLLNEDITDKKNSEKKLKESEESYKGLFYENPLSLWEEDFSEVKKSLDEIKSRGIVISSDFFDENRDEFFKCLSTLKVLKINKATFDLLKYKNKEELLKNINSTFNEVSFKTLKNEIVAIADGKKFFSEETELVKIDGEVINVIIQFRVIGDYNKVIISITDITERKKAEKEVKKAKVIAEKANRAKSEFLSNMSHEIRTPLNAIMGFTEVLKEIEEDEEKKHFLDIIEISSNDLLNIIDDVLSLAKIESGKMEINKKSVNLYEIFKNIATIFEKQAQIKELDFIFDYNGDKNRDVMLDDLAIMRIFNNLLGNAIKFTESGYIKLQLKENRENGVIEISVTDTGIGINEKKQKSLYEPFEQGEHYLTKKYGGTGLGLSIIKKLVDLMEGEISVETKLGEGTSFLIKLELEEIEEIKEIEEVPLVKLENLKEKKKVKIILAEDVEINQILIEKMVSEEGWYLKKVSNGKELIDELEKEKYDMILMDIQMPIINGIEATKVIRKNRICNDIPIIGVSAFALEEDIERALNIGMSDYISKPLKKEALLKKIYKWID